MNGYPLPYCQQTGPCLPRFALYYRWFLGYPEHQKWFSAKSLAFEWLSWEILIKLLLFTRASYLPLRSKHSKYWCYLVVFLMCILRVVTSGSINHKVSKMQLGESHYYCHFPDIFKIYNTIPYAVEWMALVGLFQPLQPAWVCIVAPHDWWVGKRRRNLSPGYSVALVMDDSLEVVAEMNARDRRAERKTEWGWKDEIQKMCIPEYRVESSIFVGFLCQCRSCTSVTLETAQYLKCK